MDKKARLHLFFNIILVSWITLGTSGREENSVVKLLQGTVQKLLQTKEHSYQKSIGTNGLLTTIVKPESTKTSGPRQPHIGLKSLIKYDKDHRHFHRRSPTSLHIRAAPVPTTGAPWPMPKYYYSSNSTQFIIDPKRFYVYVQEHYNDVLEFNLQRLWQHVFSMEYKSSFLISKEELIKLNRQPGKEFIRSVIITIEKETSRLPTSRMNESYLLKINSLTGVEIESEEVWGAIRGLETLSQLIMKEENKFYIKNITIRDSPRFSHRGLMIDTARHFIRKDIIIQNIEAMAQNKLNVFHWHLTDDQSFSFDSHKLPNITKYGAYNPVTHVYKHSDVAEIINAARLRGIRVIPEFDTPGHSFSWGFGQPDLLVSCYDKDGKPNNYFGSIHPLSDKTHKIIETLYKEVLQVFPDSMLHVGGDEVNKDCWNKNPDIKAYLGNSSLTTEDILRNFTLRLQKTVNRLFRQREKLQNWKNAFENIRPEMIFWQEAFDEGRNLSKDAVVQVWKNDEHYIKVVTDAGHKVIFSSCWYLDTTVYGIDWDLFYNCLTKETSHQTDYDGLLIGGEICLWTEYVDDDTITSKLWPRASAAAERLWSPSNLTDFTEAAKRLEEHNCRMKRFGIPSGVLNGPSFCGETLIKHPTFNISWPEEEKPVLRVKKSHRSWHKPIKEPRKSSAQKVQFPRTKHLHPSFVHESTHIIVIIFVSLIFLFAFSVLLLVFVGIMCRHVKCNSKCCTIRRIRILFHRKVIGGILIVGVVALTVNSIYFGAYVETRVP